MAGALIGLGTAAPASAAPCAGLGWVAGWAASPTDALTPTDAANDPVPTTVTRQSLRMVINPHRGGTIVRIRLSNRFGAVPVTFGAVTIGKQTRGAATGSTTPVRFAGRTTVTVAAGADAVSDPTVFGCAASDHLAVSLYASGTAAPVTKHWNANATSYLTAAAAGDWTTETSGAHYTAATGSWLYLTGLDVSALLPARSVVAFGDSITDGFVSTTANSLPADKSVYDTDQRYPDFLQRRLAAARSPISVVNAGISSNMLLTDGSPLMLGPSGVHRFDADALRQSGVGGVLLMEGINDITLTHASAAALQAGLTDVVGQAHAAGVKIWLGTLLPASNAVVNGTPFPADGEQTRQQVNTWIRQQTLADGIVDFDAALRDPANPTVLRAEYSSVDHLHPSPAGYRAMAQAVNLNMLATATCG